jgi:hypothetical protein
MGAGVMTPLPIYFLLSTFCFESYLSDREMSSVIAVR